MDNEDMELKVAGLVLSKIHEEYLAGDKFSIMRCINFCIKKNLDWPEWVEPAFRESYISLVYGDVHKIDEAFGRPYPKGAKVSNLKAKLRNQVSVYNEAKKLILGEKQVSIADDKLFAEISANLNMSVGYVKNAYYEITKRHPIVRDKPKSEGL